MFADCWSIELDHCLDDAVAVVRNQVKRSLGVREWKSVCNQLIHVCPALANKVKSRLYTTSLPPDVHDRDLLASNLLRLKADTINFRDADDHQLAAGPKQFDRLIEGL